jgi:hypothetical protein
MKKQKKLSSKVRDLEPLKNVTGGRHRAHGLHAGGFVQRGDGRAGLGPFGLNRIQ